VKPSFHLKGGDENGKKDEQYEKSEGGEKNQFKTERKTEHQAGRKKGREAGSSGNQGRRNGGKAHEGHGFRSGGIPEYPAG
jgi:hypothetical protein